uniref:Uncharacterized protein n=1 Tax=Zea mays TaxID=4577 RepID=A0A804PRC4_MAIZE
MTTGLRKTANTRWASRRAVRCATPHLDSLPSTWHARSAGSEEARGGVGAAGTTAFHHGGAAQRWEKEKLAARGLLGHGKNSARALDSRGNRLGEKKMDRVLQRDGSDRRLKTTEKALLAGGNAMGERWTSCWLEEEEGGAGWNFLGAMGRGKRSLLLAPLGKLAWAPAMGELAAAPGKKKGVHAMAAGSQESTARWKKKESSGVAPWAGKLLAMGGKSSCSPWTEKGREEGRWRTGKSAMAAGGEVAEVPCHGCRRARCSSSDQRRCRALDGAGVALGKKAPCPSRSPGEAGRVPRHGWPCSLRFACCAWGRSQGEKKWRLGKIEGWEWKIPK